MIHDPHSQGAAISITSGVMGIVTFYLKYQEAINGTLQTALLLASLAGAFIGLRKVLRR